MIKNSEKIRETFEKIRFEIFGIVGSFIMLILAPLSAIGYTGKNGESYSFLNHFVSELGEIGVSENAFLFNSSIFIGGLILVIFLVGLGFYINTKLSKFAMIISIYAGVTGALVGIFPMNNLETHTFVAMSFFFGGLFSVFFYSLAIIFQKEEILSKKLSIPGIIVVIIFATFIVRMFSMDIGEMSENPLDPTNFTRPDVWLLPIFEWAVIISVFSWALIISSYIAMKNHKKS